MLRLVIAALLAFAPTAAIAANLEQCPQERAIYTHADQGSRLVFTDENANNSPGREPNMQLVSPDGDVIDTFGFTWSNGVTRQFAIPLSDEEGWSGQIAAFTGDFELTEVSPVGAEAVPFLYLEGISAHYYYHKWIDFPIPEGTWRLTDCRAAQ